MAWKKTDYERLTKVEEQAKRNSARIKTLEENHKAISSLAENMKVVVVEVEHIKKKVDKLDDRVMSHDEVPRKKWEGISEKIISAVIMGIVMAAMTLILK